MKPKIIIVSGYFNPIDKGHLEYFITSVRLKSTTSKNSLNGINISTFSV